MLRLVAIACVLVAWQPLAHAQQDPDTERDPEAALDQALITSDTTSDDVDDAPIELRWDPALAARLRAGAGAMAGGDTISPGSGAMSIVEGALDARATRGRLQLDLPLTYKHRQTYGDAQLTDMHGHGGARVTYRFTPRVRMSGELGVGGTWKPGWRDPFQPLDDGTYGATDRYSHWDRHASLDVVVRPARYQRVQVAYDYVLSVYKHDPMFDAIYAPLHLTPWDRDTHSLDGEWRWRHAGVTVRAGGELYRTRYFFYFSGDAKTGITHAGTGGEPPNPLLRLRGAKPRVSGDVQLSDAVVVRAGYELELNQDEYQHYLSYVGHHPEAMVAWALPRGIDVRARTEAFFRRYGRSSYDYEMDPMHPPLAWGDRRAERIVDTVLEVRVPVARHWSAMAMAQGVYRRTNYTYAINWNYMNWLAWTGAEYRY